MHQNDSIAHSVSNFAEKFDGHTANVLHYTWPQVSNIHVEHHYVPVNLNMVALNSYAIITAELEESLTHSSTNYTYLVASLPVIYRCLDFCESQRPRQQRCSFPW